MLAPIACTMLFCVPQVTECCYPSPAPHFSTFKGTSDWLSEVSIFQHTQSCAPYVVSSLNLSPVFWWKVCSY